MLTTPKLNELQRPKLINKLPLIPATHTKFHTILLNCYGEMPSKLIPCVCDDLYHACTFAWGILRVLFTPHWKMLRC